MPAPPFPTNDEEELDDLASLVGRTFMDISTGFVGVVKTREDRNLGTVYWLSDASGKAQDLKTGAQLVDPTRQIVNISPTGTVTSGGKLSEGEFSSLTGAGGGGTATSFKPQTAEEAQLLLAQTEQALASAENNRASAEQAYAAAQRSGDLTEIERARQALDEAKFELEKVIADQRGAEIDLERFRVDEDIRLREADLAENARQFDIAEAGKNTREMARLKAERELLELQIDNSRRELIYSEIGATKRTLIQEQGETKRELLRQGPDPFRQQFALSGQAQRGVTPQQQASLQGLAFANQPLPKASIGMPLGELESTLANIQAIQPPTPAGAFGMAPRLKDGGTIEMSQGDDGVFSMKPTSLNNEQTYLVGDGAGVIPGVTETLTVGTDERGVFFVKVSPIAGVAQEGMNLSAEGILRPLFTSLGYNAGNIPRFTGFDRVGGTSLSTSASDMSRLGLVPEFMRDPDTGGIWQIKDGFRRLILDPQSMAGILPQDVISVPASEIAQFAPEIESFVRDPETGGIYRIRGGVRQLITDPAALAGISPTEVPNLPFGQIEGMTTSVGQPLTTLEDPSMPAFGAMGTPLIESSTRSILPSIFKIAPQLAQMQRSRPGMFSNVLSAYGNVLDPVTGLPTGGLSRDVIESQIRNASLVGSGLQGTAVG